MFGIVDRKWLKIEKYYKGKKEIDNRCKEKQMIDKRKKIERRRKKIESNECVKE